MSIRRDSKAMFVLSGQESACYGAAMSLRRLVLVIALALHCAPKKVAPQPEPEPPPPTALATAGPILLDSTTHSAILTIIGRDCDATSASVTVREGSAWRVHTVVPTKVPDGYALSLAREELAPPASRCDAERRYALTAAIVCDGEEAEAIEGEATVIEREDAMIETSAGTGPRGHFFARLYSAPRSGQWVFDGDTVTFLSAGAPVTLTSLRAARDAPLEVTGTAHAFLTVEPDATSPAEGFAIPDDQGAVFFMRDEWIVAAPLGASGTLDGRTQVARLRVPAPVIDLAVSGGTLYVLSQADSRVVLSTIVELSGWATGATVSPDAVTVLPYSESKGFAASPSGQLTVMAANTDDGSFELYNPATTAKENAPPDPCLTPTSPAPIPYPTPSGGGTGGGGGSGSSSFPISSGDQPGSAGGVSSGGVKGCPKQFSSGVKFPARDSLTTPDGAFEWTGVYSNAPGLIALLFSSTADESQRRVLLYDTAADTSRWLQTTNTAIARMMFAPDGTRVVISGGQRYDVFTRDGAWLAGSALPDACGMIRDVTIDATYRIRLR